MLSRKTWLAVTLSGSIVVAGTVVAAAAVTGKVHHHHKAQTICHAYDRRTIESRGVYYIVRNDVFFPEQECLRVQGRGVGFTVTKTHANSYSGDNDAYPEAVYGCAWGVCTKHTILPRRIWRLHSVVTSWTTSWRRAHGKFNVAYDIWFGHLRTIHGHALGAELMIWLGTKKLGSAVDAPIYRIDGVRWYYRHHLACDIYGCWNYILFRRVVPSAHAYHLRLLPFFHFAIRHRKLSLRWWLKSIDVGFEIWQNGKGLAVHSYSVRISLNPLRPRKHKPGK